jgi:hypothetical protein
MDIEKKEPESAPSFWSEFWVFLKHNKRYWLLPIVIVIVLLAIFILFTESSALAPFIYDIF